MLDFNGALLVHNKPKVWNLFKNKNTKFPNLTPRRQVGRFQNIFQLRHSWKLARWLLESFAIAAHRQLWRIHVREVLKWFEALSVISNVSNISHVFKWYFLFSLQISFFSQISSWPLKRIYTMIMLRRKRLFLHWLCAHCRAEPLCSAVQSQW